MEDHEHKDLDDRIRMVEVQITLARWVMALLLVASVSAAAQAVIR